MNIVLCVGALLGFVAVLSGAYTDHAFQSTTVNGAETLATAIRYLQFNAIVISGIGLGLWLPLPRLIRARLQLSAWIFILGASIFSFSLLFSQWVALPALQKFTPVGGTLLLMAWLCLIWAALGGYKPEYVETPKHWS